MNVFINGVMLRPSHDYVLASDYIDFKHPPQAGDRIDLQAGSWGQAIIATGVQRKVTIDASWQDMGNINMIIMDAWEHRDHPMIQDALDRLRAATALVKE